MLLERLVGSVVDVDELDRVARSKTGARLARQLREEGFPVETHVDAPDLNAGEFRLATTTSTFMLDEGQRVFNEETRGALFVRDRYRCWRCRRDRFDALRDGASPFFLVAEHSDARGADLVSLTVEQVHNLSRLRTVCVRCALGLPD
jgi:hypothetical protein